MKYKLTLIFGVAFAAMVACSYGAPAKKNWDQHCAVCHGKDGKGQTPMGKRFGVKDYTSAKAQTEFKDEEAFKAIKDGIEKEGKKRMPAFGSKLSDDDIHALVKYIREFKKGD